VPFNRETVVPSAPLPGSFDPPALDPAASLQSIEQGVKRGNLEANRAIRPRLDELAELVAVASVSLKQGQNEELGASLLQVGAPHIASDYMLF
jgi:hypothetical protein